MKKLSLIVSVYNEEASLAHFYDVTTEVLKNMDANGGEPYEAELVFVNDGSKDKSLEILSALADKDERVKVISFSRNFGHEAAMTAGIDYATGDFLICLDADLQNPPELIPKILAEYEGGSDVVLMAREENKSAGFLKKVTSAMFYKLLNKLSEVEFERNVSDFFGISKRAADLVRDNYREKTRYLRGFIQQIGFKRSVISYKAPARYAGESKYSIGKLFGIAMHTFDCFSVTPLKAGLAASALSIVLTIASFIYYIVFWIRNDSGSGVALLCTLLTFLFSILFLLLGVVGQYLGNIMREVRNRPVYIVDSTINTEKDR